MTGRVFEIREFTVHDGPGIRTTVFLKGCPLRCRWCHNPEGQSFEKEWMRRRDGSRVECGRDYEPAELARELLVNADIMGLSGGGITFSGGEPLAQAGFLLAVVAEIRRRASVGVAVETSGGVAEDIYRQVVSQLDFVYQDVKLPTAEGYRKWCGVDGETILRNIAWLKTSRVRHVLRVPVIPGVNDSEECRLAISDLVGDSPVEYLPYNVAAGAKYPMLGRVYEM